MTELRIAVIGAGATGGYMAAMLARAGVDVTVVARGRSLTKIAADGIRIEDHEGRIIVARPARVVAAGEAAAVDVALLCVKSQDTAGIVPALDRLIGPDGRVLCLQNGVENEDILRRALGAERVMAGVLYVGAERLEPGVVRCRTPVRLIFGPTHGSNRELASRLKAMFDAAGIDCSVDDEILASKWQKFLFNCGLNPLTTLTGLTMGRIMAEPEGRKLVEGLVDEAIAVGRACGAPLRPDARDRVLETAVRMDISSSMAEDLAAGRPLELDAFTGYVCRLGHEHDTPLTVTPVIHDLLALCDPARRAASAAAPSAAS